MESAILFAWDTIKTETIDSLCASFRDRLQLVIENGGKSISDILRRHAKPRVDFDFSHIPDSIERYDQLYLDINATDDLATEDNAVPFNISPDEWNSWSDIKKKQYTSVAKSQNSFHYRSVSPGEKLVTGPFSKSEHILFMRRLAEFNGNVAGRWGLFSIAIPGRVGYQCSNYHRKLKADGIVK